MKQPFEIAFDFALAHSDFVVSLRATAELHHSAPYYVVDNFHTAVGPPVASEISVIPPQEIKKITRNGSTVWVHRDSERESLLSIAIGKAIDGMTNGKKNNK